MKIPCGAQFRVDHYEHPFHLLCCHAHRWGDFARRDTVVPRKHAQIHLAIRQIEVEFLLRLLERVSIRGWWPSQYLFRYTQMLPEGVHLRFVEMRDRLEIG